MNRATFDAMLAQYATPTVTGEGAVSWDKGAHCVIPSVEITGKCVQDGTPTPDAPIEPVFSEGAEVVARGRNLLDVSAVQLGKGLYGPGPGSKFSVSPDANKALFRIDSITEGTAYTLTINNANAKIWRMMVVDDQNFCTDHFAWYAFSKEQGPLANFTAKKSADTPGKISYIMFVIKKKDETEITYEDVIAAEPRIVLGTYTADTMPAYEPYFDGGTAVAPQLLAIPGTEYRDEWNPQTGRGVRRLHKFVMDGTDKRNFKEVHNTQPADVFVVWAGLVNGQTGSGSPLGLTDTTEVLCNYFPYESGYFYNNVGAFRHANRYYGLAAKFPYSMFGITKGEKTGEELLALVNAWLVEKNDEGNPLYYYYVMETPEEFQTDPQPLIQPKGTGQLIQTGGTVDGCPITVKCVTHS